MPQPTSGLAMGQSFACARLRRRSSGRTPREIDDASQAELFGNLMELRLAGGKESAQQPALSQLRHAESPASSIDSHSLKNSGQLRRNRGLSLAKEAAGIVDQRDIATQWEACHHSFASRVEPASVFNRTEPQGLFLTSDRERASDAHEFSEMGKGRPLFANPLSKLRSVVHVLSLLLAAIFLGKCKHAV